MRLWVEVYDASANRIGEGPVINLASASVSRRLDGAGQISLNVPGTDLRAVELLTKERRVRIWVELFGTKRELGRGIIRKCEYRAGTGGYTLTVNGIDDLDELKRVSVLINRQYDNEQVQDIADDLLTLVSGWTASSSVTDTMSIRLDGVSVLKALQEIAKLTGLHIRRQTGASVVELGAFGSSSGVVLLNADQVTEAMYGNDKIALIDSITLQSESAALVNRLYVFGGGANLDSALSLADSTRISPYTIQNTTVNGRTLYYIEDSASVTAYGAIEKVGTFKEIAPLSNNDTDIERAANALYDAASAWLTRYKDPQETYKLTLKKVTQTIEPGDKVRLIYKDPIQRDDGSFVPPRNIDAEFWVLSVTESVGLNGLTTSLEISDVDRYEETTAKTIIGKLDEIRLQGLNIQPTINHYTYGPEQIEINSSNSGTVQLVTTDATLSIDRVLMRVRTRPFTSTAVGGVAGGLHRHRMFANPGTLQFWDSGSSVPYRAMDCRDSGAGSVGFNFFSGASVDMYTYDADGSHTHAPIYGIYRDTQYPTNVSITVNGTSVGSGLDSGGTGLDTTIDITSEILGKAGGWRDVAHDVVVSCASGQGEVVVTFDVYETITPFRYGA